VEAATPPSRTTFQLIRQAHRPWRRVLPTDARASAAPSSVTTAEGFVNAATEIRPRCPSRHHRPYHQRLRHQYASLDATHAAIIGTRSTLTRFHSRNTAAAAGAPSSSKTCASRVALTAPATRRLHRRRRCHHRPVQYPPRRRARLPRHPHPCSHTCARTIRWWALRLVDARPRWPRGPATVILTTRRLGWWWVSSSRTVR